MKDEIIDVIFWVLALLFIFFLLPAEPSPSIHKRWQLTQEYTGWVWYADDTPVHFDRVVEWTPGEVKR